MRSLLQEVVQLVTRVVLSYRSIYFSVDRYFEIRQDSLYL